MSLHPPTAICNGRLDDDDEEDAGKQKKSRVLLTNPETQRGSVHSTDQTYKNRPEWLFPRCPANVNYMVRCSMIITDYDENHETKTLPEDMSKLRAKGFWGGADDDDEELEFIVRRHNNEDSDLKSILENKYFQKECIHGIIVLVPSPPMDDDLLPPDEILRRLLDAALLDLIQQEEESIERAMQSMMMRMMRNQNNENDDD